MGIQMHMTGIFSAHGGCTFLFTMVPDGAHPLPSKAGCMRQQGQISFALEWRYPVCTIQYRQNKKTQKQNTNTKSASARRKKKMHTDMPFKQCSAVGGVSV